MIQQLLSAGLGKAVDSVLGRFFEDKDKAAAAAQELRLAMLEHEQTAQQVARDVVVAEAKSEHWITSAWRPIVMLMFAVMIGNNFIIAPYLDAFFGTSVMFDMPDQAWGLLSVGLGGYVVGRSAEKVAREVRKKG
jgi:predicted MFS family arabinose efflux permease